MPRAAVIPADLDGELAQQLQKLSKRDATTRLKALQVGPGIRARRCSGGIQYDRSLRVIAIHLPLLLPLR